MSRGLILGIETSCDETAAAVVERGARTLSSVVASQIATHARYGGVVPELASREHLRAVVPVVRTALEEAHASLADLDAIAVTSGPGLAGALLVGITYAKALAFANQLPLVAVNHLEGHIHAVLLNEREAASVDKNSSDGHPERALSKAKGKSKDLHFSGAPGLDSETGENTTAGALGPLHRNTGERTGPRNSSALALVVSGGHTHLYLAEPAHGTWRYTLVGRTVDDAAGEAFDKVTKLLGLGYPGGPWIDALARFGDPHAVPFAFAQFKRKAHLAGKAPARTKAAMTAPIARLDPRFLFSFSGIKTAVLRYVEINGLRAEAKARVDRIFSGAPSYPHSSAAKADRVGGQVGPPAIPRTREEALTLCPQPTLDLIASFQHAVIGDLMKKTFAAAESLGAGRVLVTGGVAANRELRERFTAEAARRNAGHPERALSKAKEKSKACPERGLQTESESNGDLHYSIAFPTLVLSTDNAAMIAAAAWPRFLAGEFAPADLSADPSLALC